MLTQEFKKQNSVTLCVQYYMLGGWIDLYVHGRLVLTKKFASDSELESLKKQIMVVAKSQNKAA